MNAIITIETKDVGDRRRGYHNHDAIITFDYKEHNWWPKAREEQIVRALTNGLTPGMYMWYKIEQVIARETNLTDSGASQSIWKVNHGYDSGD